MSVASLILGIIGLLTSCIVIGIIPSIIGLILGILSMKSTKNKGASIAGIVTSAVGILIFVIILVGAMGISDSVNEEEPVKVETSAELESEAEVESEEVSEATEEETTTVAESETEEEQVTFGIGETAELNDVQVTMLDYYETSGSDYNKPSDGNTFVLIEFEVANNSDEEIIVSSMMSFEAYADDYSLNYSIAAILESDENQLDGTIAPGKKMKGEIGYEVPADWSDIEIHFTESVWSDSDFVFEITK